MSLTQRWWLAIRPKTLTAAIAPVLAGAALALHADVYRVGAAFAALFGSIMIQIGTNLVNDVVDYQKGTDKEGRLGPTRVTQAGLLSIDQVWVGVWVSFGLATLAGIYLWWAAGFEVVLIGLASILAGIAYTAGPYPLAYIGLGDPFVMIFFGFVAVCGTVFVITGAVLPASWWLAAVIGALTVNILVVNNIRDIESDREAGRTNIPVAFGRTAAEWEYELMLFIAYLTPPLLAYRYNVTILTFLVYLSLPQAVILARTLRSGLAGPPLNPILGQTAQLLFRYALLFAVGMVLGEITGV